MLRILRYLIFVGLIVGWQARAKTQDTAVPAGTLLHCTLEEPNFSSATANVGDPVFCHLGNLDSGTER